MDYIEPSEVARTMASAAAGKAQLPVGQLLLRGLLSGALLGVATSLAFTVTAQGLPPIIGAMLFPVGFAMIILLSLELVTGSFALLPLAWIHGQAGPGRLLANLLWVYAGNLLGGLLYAVLFAAVQTQFGHAPASGAGALIAAAAAAKTLGYQKLGAPGIALAVVKAILCNWMVCMGVVMGMTSRSTAGKVLACWLPILTFFAQGFEHSVVNMFLIPAGMMLGAKISPGQWWIWNQLPVTLGNILGGFLLVGLPIHLAYGRAAAPRSAGMAEAAGVAGVLPENAEA